MSKQDTIISLLKEIDKNIDNIGGGGNVPKVKVSQLKVSNVCINDDGRWEGENIVDFSECISLSNTFMNTKLKILDTRSWDLSKVNNLDGTFDNCRILEEVKGIENWNTSSVINLFCFIRGVKTLINKRLDLTKWKVSNVTNVQNFISNSNIELNIENWDTSKITDFSIMFFQNTSTYANIVGTNAESATKINNMFDGANIETIVGDYTLDEVINKNIKVLNGLKINIPNTFGGKNLNRASLRALINGLADLTGQTAQTLTIGETLIAKLTEEDIAIATAKNWTIA